MENRGLIRSSKANVSSRDWAAPIDAILSVPLWLREIICLGANESARLNPPSAVTGEDSTNQCRWMHNRAISC
ncbi:MAG: hypothetical protein RLY70_1760 [Planctomycetota bacterium]